MSLRTIGAVTVAAVASALLVAPAQAQDTGSRFTLGVLPDTQFYSRYATPETGNLAAARYGSEPFAAQTEWLAQNQSALNMAFATHLGDVVDQSDVEGEWLVADKAMATLDDSSLSYSILPGNHDMSKDGVAHPFNDHFSAERARAHNDTFQERYTAPNADAEYHIFEAEGQQYMVLALPWRAPQEVLDWAQAKIDAHPTLPVILTAHEILNIDGAGQVFYSDTYGQHLWDSFISRNDQIFLTMAGHHHGAGYRVDKNAYGHDVVSILQDYQMAYQGGNGLLGVLEFDLSGKQLDMTALSPWVAKKPAKELTQFDHLILDGKGDSYTIDFDFQTRFARFAPDWKVGDANETDLSAAARSIVSAGYTPFEIAPEQLPVSTQDFVTAPGTVFHWRPGQATAADGTLLADAAPAAKGAIIPEVFAGKDNLVRETGADGRVVYSTDHHPLSSDAGSLYWTDPAGSLDVATFKTAEGAAVNNVDTTAGYTFESFVKIPADFNGEKHGWGNALARESAIARLVEGSTDTDPTIMFGISNLRELRWWAEPKEGSGSTVWSHEVPKDEWLHIAVVNDPNKDTVEMFINGAPILRNAAGAEGLLPRDLRWVMGAGYDNLSPQDPWYGWIGETRLTQGVLTKDQWLTARNPEVHNAPETTTPTTTTPVTSAPATSTSSTSAPDTTTPATTVPTPAGSSKNGSSTVGTISAVVSALALLGGVAVLGMPYLKHFAKKFGLKIPGLTM